MKAIFRHFKCQYFFMKLKIGNADVWHLLPFKHQRLVFTFQHLKNERTNERASKRMNASKFVKLTDY